MENKPIRPKSAAQGTSASTRRAASSGASRTPAAGQKPQPRETQPRGTQPRGTQPRGTRSARGLSGIERAILKLSALTSSPRGLLKLGGFFLALILVIVAVGLIASCGGGTDRSRESVRTAAVTSVEDAGEATAEGANPEEGATPEGESPDGAEAAGDGETAEGADAEGGETEASANAGNAGPVSRPDETWQDGKYAPEPQGEGYLPVFRRAEREDKVIAITVDDCFQTNNLRQIIQLAEDVGGKLTIFPIGELLQREGLQEVIRYAHDIGFEIENHTWSHDSLYNFSAQELAAHIFNQDRAVDYVLGVNYYTHFLRPRGGDDRNDLRTHSYIKQLGYYGIAHWSVSGGSSNSTIAKGLEPGAVYLFHCTDTDLAKLQGFIPYAAEQGYRLITMNEMFGYADNYVEPLTDDPKTREIPQLEPYERDYKTLKATTYDYAAYEVQEALIAKGYMKGSPDGIYGPGTAKSASAWQKAAGYSADGVLTPAQQRELLGVN